MFVGPVNKDVKKSHFQIPKDRRMALLGLFERYEVRYTFHGHTHWNSVITSGPITQVVTSSITTPLGKDASGYRWVEVNEKGELSIDHFIPITN